MNNPEEMPRVGFVGLGLMGYPMARNLSRKGFLVSVYNRTRSKADALAAESSVTVTDTPRAVADGADIVITMVSDVPDVEEVYLAPGTGILESARAGMVCVDMGTVGGACVQKVAARLRERGCGFVDAPVSGGSWGAQNGTLSIMAGGAKPDFERVLPALRAMGERITYCGASVGDGQKVKLVNQIAVALTTESVCEGLLFAIKTGANVDAALEAVGAGAGGSWAWTNLGPRVAKADYAPGFKAGHLIKDLRLAADAARAAGISLPGTNLVLTNLEKLVADDPQAGSLGTQALIKALRG